MDGIRQTGMIIIQAFQKIPGVSEVLGNTNLSTFQLIAGIFTIALFVIGAIVIILGCVKFGFEKYKNEKEGSNNKKPSSYLIGGLVGGGILLLTPTIILIIGSAMGSIATVS